MLICSKCKEYKGVVTCERCGNTGCAFCSLVSFGDEDQYEECDHETITEIDIAAIVPDSD